MDGQTGCISTLTFACKFRCAPVFLVMQHGIATHTTNKVTHRLIRMAVLRQQVLRTRQRHPILNIRNIKRTLSIHMAHRAEWMPMNITRIMVMVLLIRHRMSTRIRMVCALLFVSDSWVYLSFVSSLRRWQCLRLQFLLYIGRCGRWWCNGWWRYRTTRK